MEANLDFVTGVEDIYEYTGEKIDDEQIMKLLEFMRKTPSSANMQPWELYIIYSKSMKERLQSAILDGFLRDDDPSSPKPFLLMASHLFVVCCDKKRAEARFGEEGLKFSYLDIGAAVYNVRLACLKEGLGTTWIKEISGQKVREITGIQKNHIIIGILAIGRINEKRDEKFVPLMSLNDFVHMERW